VSAAHPGKYLAFTETGSNGMKHLTALADAGLTDWDGAALDAPHIKAHRSAAGARRSASRAEKRGP